MEAIVITEGKGINTAQRGLDHTVVAQLLIPAEVRQRRLLVPEVVERNGEKQIVFYVLSNALLPNPRSSMASRRASTVWYMSDTDNQWNEENGPNWGYDNPVYNSNPKMLDLIKNKAPFNSLVVTGNISTEYVPANYEVDINPLVDAAVKVMVATHAMKKAKKTPAEQTKAANAVKEAYRNYMAIKQEMVDTYQLVKSNIFFARRNGIVLTNTIVQGMNLPGSATLSAAALWENPKSKLTYAPHVLSYTGAVTVNSATHDADHNDFAYGVQTVQDSERQFCRKGGSVFSAGRESSVRVDIFDNNLGTRSRAQTFDDVTARNGEIVVLNGRVSVHPYHQRNSAMNVVLASKFHIEIETYATMQQTGNSAQVVDTENFESFGSFTMELDEIEIQEPVEPAQQQVAKTADSEDDPEMPWEA